MRVKEKIKNIVTAALYYTLLAYGVTSRSYKKNCPENKKSEK